MTGLRELRKKSIAPVYRGCRVRVPDGNGSITQSDGYHRVRVRLDGEKLGSPYHLSSILEYLPESTAK